MIQATYNNITIEMQSWEREVDFVESLRNRPYDVALSDGRVLKAYSPPVRRLHTVRTLNKKKPTLAELDALYRD